jgi:hypothetical protein
MPTFDGGHYFLTLLIPISTKHVRDGTTVTSPVHALRKRLDKLSTKADRPASAGGQSPNPFARNTRNHFARFAVIDDVAYNGRTESDTLVSAALRTVLTDAQPQDHLHCPFLLFAADFDAANGSDAERDSYFAELWRTMEGDLRDILTFCQGFDAQVKDAASFAAYMAKCQLETTMSFNDYYISDDPKLPAWPANIFLWGALASGVALLMGVAATLLLLVAGLFTSSMQGWLPAAFGLSIVGLVVLLLVAVAAYLSVMGAGKKPFPTVSYANLPTVLKALHLQRVFTGFAIEHQIQAAGTDAASAQQLYDGFKAFLAANKPDDLQAPTQPPGVIGI